MRTTIKAWKISKILFLLYVVYTYVTSYSLFFIKSLSPVLLLGALLFALIATGLRFIKDGSFLFFVVFTAFIVATAFTVAYDSDKAFSSAKMFIEFLISYLLIILYSDADQSIHFAINVFVLHGLLAEVLMLFSGMNTFRISFSESVNVNTIGTMLTFSIAFILYEMIAAKKTVLKVVICVSAILLLLIGIMLTVSKKSIFASAALILLWIVCCYRTTFINLKRSYRVLLFAALILIGYLVYRWYTSTYAAQIEYMLYRMSQTVEGDSTQRRIFLIKEGVQTFLEHPILGVGFNNARYYSEYATYTHCFYVELLACTGIIGTLIFSSGMVSIWAKIGSTFKRFRSFPEVKKNQIVFMIIIYLVLLVYSWTQIIFYIYSLMYMLATLNAFGNLLKSTNRELAAN